MKELQFIDSNPGQQYAVKPIKNSFLNQTGTTLTLKLQAGADVSIRPGAASAEITMKITGILRNGQVYYPASNYDIKKPRTQIKITQEASMLVLTVPDQ